MPYEPVRNRIEQNYDEKMEWNLGLTSTKSPYGIDILRQGHCKVFEYFICSPSELVDRRFHFLENIYCSSCVMGLRERCEKVGWSAEIVSIFLCYPNKTIQTEIRYLSSSINFLQKGKLNEFIEGMSKIIFIIE